MYKSITAVFLLFLSCSTEDCENIRIVSILDFVNHLLGTDSKHSLSNGNTYPAIATPWGNNIKNARYSLGHYENNIME